MDLLLSIGEFSRMTHLSVKALRHYHEVGVLVPADIDASTGYRRYTATQIPTAQAIRRFRDLDMPLEQVKAVIDAPDPDTRNQAISEHLLHMERQLEQTQTTVASLRQLLADAGTTAAPLAVEHRRVGASQVLAIHKEVGWDDTEGWLEAAYAELHAAVESAGARRAGPDGALYSDEFFEYHLGEVAAFVPIVGGSGRALPVPGRTELVDLPAAHLAVATHKGPFADLDQTYGALGTYVTERGLAIDGPIRENYDVGPDGAAPYDLATEVCWPILPTP